MTIGSSFHPQNTSKIFTVDSESKIKPHKLNDERLLQEQNAVLLAPGKRSRHLLAHVGVFGSNQGACVYVYFFVWEMVIAGRHGYAHRHVLGYAKYIRFTESQLRRTTVDKTLFYEVTFVESCRYRKIERNIHVTNDWKNTTSTWHWAI